MTIFLLSNLTFWRTTEKQKGEKKLFESVLYFSAVCGKIIIELKLQAAEDRAGHKL